MFRISLGRKILRPPTVLILRHQNVIDPANRGRPVLLLPARRKRSPQNPNLIRRGPVIKRPLQLRPLPLIRPTRRIHIFRPTPHLRLPRQNIPRHPPPLVTGKPGIVLLQKIPSSTSPKRRVRQPPTTNHKQHTTNDRRPTSLPRLRRKFLRRRLP